MKRYLIIPVLVLCYGIMLSACSFAGLDFQKSPNYNGKVVSNEVNETAWEYINNRPDQFQGMIDAIKYAEVESFYKTPGNTYILLTNTALITTSNLNSYWVLNPVPQPGDPGTMIAAGAWEQYPKEQVAELMKYHILKGEWSFFNISDAVNWVKTYGSGEFTYVKDGVTLQGDTAVVDIRIGFDRGNPMQLNNYVWNYRGLLSESTASTTQTNIHANNGYLHVTNFYLPRPTRVNLGLE